MSNKTPYKQDLPPKGGYPQLQIARVQTWAPKRNYIKNDQIRFLFSKNINFYKAWALAGAFIAFLPVGYYLQKERKRNNQ